RALLLLEGVTDVDAAKALQFQRVEALASERPELDEDAFLLEDLVGLPVRTEDGTELGTVENVLAYPAQDLLKVGDLLIPFIEEFVLECDLESGLVVKLLPGMEPGAD
ncbi:MAG: ribosome maturation factor RimM, partial [Nitrospirae bacterium]|nr:ribosome maturation factor RimM [Fimbriimonadaceae bacterium]